MKLNPKNLAVINSDTTGIKEAHLVNVIFPISKEASPSSILDKRGV
jgi:hypothetical protein